MARVPHRAQLVVQVDAASSQVKSQENSIRTLVSQVSERQAVVVRLESLPQSEGGERCGEQSRAEAMEKRVAEFSKELAAKVADRKSWQQRESELEQCVSAQKRQLADAAAAARAQAEELNHLKSTIDDLQVIQSALCARVREMSSHFDTASRRLQELDDQYQAAAQMIQSRDQEFAILRQAIAEAATDKSDTDGEHSAVE